MSDLFLDKYFLSDYIKNAQNALFWRIEKFMNAEYLIFNIVVAAGPIACSFEKRVYFFKRWHQAVAAVLIVAVPFIIWDALVTGSHWWFNERFISGVYIAGLPLGEWLFFLTVPFACLFVWEVLNLETERLDREITLNAFIWVAVASLVGTVCLALGKHYTMLVAYALALIPIVDKILKTGILKRSLTYIFLLISTGLMLIFNGYLTARPVVLYNADYQLDWRVFTIPVEDFGYGYALLLLTLMLYEYLKRRAI